MILIFPFFFISLQKHLGYGQDNGNEYYKEKD